MQARLAEIDIDGLLTPAAVEEYLLHWLTADGLSAAAQDADRFAQALLGRAGLLVDGLPLGYLAPVDLGYLTTSAEDRGTDFVSASFCACCAMPPCCSACCCRGSMSRWRPFTRRCCRRSCCSRF